MKRLTRYFLEGLLIAVPVVVTIFVVYKIFTTVDTLFPFEFPGLGFVLTLLIITIIGFVSSNFLTRGIVGMVDRTFSRLPLVKMIYTSIKDLINAFVGDKKSFNKPVLVTLNPATNVEAVGFITKESLDELGIADRVAVYLPQSYNFAGNLLVVPPSQVRPIEIDSGRVMAFIVSGGVASKQSD